jgi:hypothetical protein
MPPCTEQLRRPTQHRQNHPQKRLLVLLLCAALLWVSGCSVFVATPKTTRVKVTGLNNLIDEYIIVTNEPDETELDIRLTDRYTLCLDFQWIWNDHISPAEMDSTLINDGLHPQLTPWITCKYRF